MNAFTFALSLIASLVSTPAAPAKHDAGIIVLDRIGTVAPARKAHFAPHRVGAPVVRFVDSTPGCVTRTLARDASGQKVTYCN